MADSGKSVTGHIAAKVFALVGSIVAILAILAVLQTQDIEHGILDVCATQQDGYVQLVLDQINLKENRDDEEIISDILETMDASSNKYWVFSRDQTMLFVKDVTETNRYKGFSASSYWGTADAQTFLDSLQQGVVKHDFIELEGVEYLASGSIFTYDDREYRLCLLTNKTALLDNNGYLGARSRLSVAMAIALGLLIVIPMALAFTVASERKKLAAKQDVIASLNVRLQEVSDRMAHGDLYDSRKHVWSAEAFGPFVEKILKRGVDNAYLVQVVCTDADTVETFISQAAIMLNEKIVRFRMADEIVVLLFLENDRDHIISSVRTLLNEKTKLGAVVPVKPDKE